MTILAHDSGTVEIPLAARIVLGHCVIQALADIGRINLMHIKGYAAAEGLYRPGRVSTDVDVLVDPQRVDDLLQLMTRHGWEVKTSFESGSIFHHASTLWHEYWGYCDVHRLFPGISVAPDIAFTRLWDERSSQAIGGRPCHVPSRLHQALLIALHGARDPWRGAADVAHLRQVLSQDSWAALSSIAAGLGADIPWAASTGALDHWSSHKDYALWKSLSTGGGRSQLFLARWQAETGIAGRFRLLVAGMSINRDHLAMKLRRAPAVGDYVAEARNKAATVVMAMSRWLKENRRKS